jgi:hypothetical protein
MSSNAGSPWRYIQQFFKHRMQPKSGHFLNESDMVLLRRTHQQAVLWLVVIGRNRSILLKNSCF